MRKAKMYKSIMRSIAPCILGIPVLSHKYANKVEQSWIQARRQEIKLLGWPSDKIKDYSWLVGHVKNESSILRSQSCHIIGSGSSVIESTRHIRPSDYVIGFGYASLLPLDYNLYFMEACTGRFTSLFAECIRGANINLLVCKNLSKKQFEMALVPLLYDQYPIAVPDVTFPWKLNRFARLFNRNFLAARLLCADETYIKQARSSIFTCIVLAIHAGFRQIVVHGLDMGGPHFYANSSIEWPDASNKDLIKQLIEFTDGHHQPSLRYKDILYGLKTLARRLGINLVAGSSASKAAEILGAIDKH